jgi:PPOX class probable F420-dependent enzyme
LDEKTAWGLAGTARVGRLATYWPAGPHLVPVVFAVDGPDLVSAVDSKPKTTVHLQRLENLRQDPRAALLVDHYEEDWSKLWWVRFDCVGRIVESGPEFDGAIAALVEKYEQYRSSPPPGPVIRLRVGSLTSWSASDRD